MAKEVEEIVKPISDLTADEALTQLAEIAAKKRELSLLEDTEIALVNRVNEVNRPIEAMSVEELQAEVMKLDAVNCDVVKPFYKRRADVFNALKAYTGPGFQWEGDTVIDGAAGIHWQDEKGIVWATEQTTGTFVEFRDFTVTRTRDLERDETKGLSMTKARKLGYVVEGK